MCLFLFFNLKNSSSIHHRAGFMVINYLSLLLLIKVLSFSFSHGRQLHKIAWVGSWSLLKLKVHCFNLFWLLKILLRSHCLFWWVYLDIWLHVFFLATFNTMLLVAFSSLIFSVLIIKWYGNVFFPVLYVWCSSQCSSVLDCIFSRCVKHLAYSIHMYLIIYFVLG